MGCYEKILKKGNLHSLRDFVLSDFDSADIEIRSYEERIQTTEKLAYEMIIEHFPDYKNQERLHNYLDEVISSNKEVYLEIGIKLGARFAIQLLTD